MPQLSIIVPTFNGIRGVAELTDRVAAALPGVDWEMIFVDDDSPDDTATKLRGMAQRDARLRCIQRIGRRGLASACIEGMLAASAPLVAVIDPDYRHDERLLAEMFRVVSSEELDVVVASRSAESRGADAAGPLAARLSRLVLKAELQDPMSGFFMIRHDAMVACVRAGMSGVGFKILLELFAASPTPLRYRELPCQVRAGFAGESRLETNFVWEYFVMLLDKFLGGLVPIRFIAFSLVGGFGVFVHMAVLASLFKGAGTSFLGAQTAAAMVAMTSNYLLNNLLTYRDLRLRGWRFVRGWVSFVFACSIGAVANVGIAAALFERDAFWVSSAIAGILVGAVWNYAMTAVYTWKTPRAS